MANDPDTIVIAHPECREDVIAMADEVWERIGQVRFGLATDEIML